MRQFFPVIFSLVFILVVGALELIFLRLLNRDWWRKKWIRRAAWSLPLGGVIMTLLWGVAAYHNITWLTFPAALLAVVAFVLEFGLMMSLPLSGVIHFLQRLIDRFVRHSQVSIEPTVDRKRRIFMKSAAGALPLVTLAAGTFGVGRAFDTARVYRRELAFENLPRSLDGMRILHLSDLHLQQYVNLDDLEAVLREAEAYRPHLVLVTGDVADDLAQLPEALNMIEQLKAPLGTYASLGNHEYFRGIRQVRTIFDSSAVPLLVNQGVSVSVNAQRLFVGGIDDPRRMGSKEVSFYRDTIDRTMQDHTGEDFTLLMSHRPDALDYASEAGIDLTLAGHTHGGQIGFRGKSAFENVWPERYLWGHYRRKNSQLYTSSGVGHWFPFRLGCPPEAPVIVLRRA